MRTLLLSDTDVETLLPMAECIEVMDDALRALAHGAVDLPLRQILRLGDTPSVFALMPSVLSATDKGARRPVSVAAKVITVFPENDATPYDSHIGVVLLFEGEHGRLLAVLDASSITAIRTAAVSGLATRLLARPDAGDLAILGSGVQAMTHLDAMRSVRTIRRVRVWSRTPAKAKQFAERAGLRWGIHVETATSAEEAVRGADLVCTTTSSRTPVLHGAWLASGAHVNAVGASLRTARELDTDAVVRAQVYVDRMESAMAEAGDILIPIAEGAITKDHIRGELGALLLGKIAGPEGGTGITLFKSLGIAVEDLAAARYLYEKALRTERGSWFHFGGLRHEAS